MTTDWARAGNADVTADSYAAANGGMAPIIVMADSNGSATVDTECVNSSRGNAEMYLTVDVPAFIRKRYKTATGPSKWAVGGLSEGGMCGLMLTLRHPDVSETFLDLGGLPVPRSSDGTEEGSAARDLFGGDEAAFDAHEPLDILRKQRFPRIAGWFVVGTKDPDPLAAQNELVPAARAAGIQVCSVFIPGGEHSFAVWSAAFADSIGWLGTRLGLSDEPVACPNTG